MADFDVKGLAELQKSMAGIGDKMAKKVLRVGLRQAANVVRNQARANFGTAGGPNDLTGALRASIRVTPRRGTPTRVSVSVVAGALTNAQKKRFGVDAAFYALWVERGHWLNRGKALGGNRKNEARARRIAAGEVKYVPAKPFMAPAIKTKAQEAIDILASTVRAKLQEVV